MGVLTREELVRIGFATVGEEVFISDKASFYGIERIQIGNHVRIDDFCVFSAGQGGIQIGDYVHVGIQTSLIGAGRITINHFCNLSSRVSIYSSNDDYSGLTMTNPMVPPELRGVTHAPVTLERHVIVGSGSVILPGVTIEEGVAVGALSLVRDDCTTFGIYGGNPARRIAERKRDLLLLAQQLEPTPQRKT
jgi:dTDP-4-amino-4,6-dideoxy-D-glucose acyltransferase